MKKKSNPRRGSNPGKMGLEAVALSNDPRKYHLTSHEIYNI